VEDNGGKHFCWGSQKEKTSLKRYEKKEFLVPVGGGGKAVPGWKITWNLERWGGEGGDLLVFWNLGTSRVLGVQVYLLRKGGKGRGGNCLTGGGRPSDVVDVP